MATTHPFQRLNTPARMVKMVWLQRGRVAHAERWQSRDWQVFKISQDCTHSLPDQQAAAALPTPCGCFQARAQAERSHQPLMAAPSRVSIPLMPPAPPQQSTHAHTHTHHYHVYKSHTSHTRTHLLDTGPPPTHTHTTHLKMYEPVKPHPATPVAMLLTATVISSRLKSIFCSTGVVRGVTRV